MKPWSFMFVAGEPSGDILAAELAQALRKIVPERTSASSSDYQPLQATLAPRFFGAGGPRMRSAGVTLELDMMGHSVTGLSDVLKKLLHFRQLLHQLADLAQTRQPDVLVCVDFSGFNRRLAHAVRKRACRQDWFHPWHPRIVQYVSPQVWASRKGRAPKMARDLDLLLSIFPFEKDWYAAHTPGFNVQFVGHPMLDRYRDIAPSAPVNHQVDSAPEIVLLPGSRPGELERHLPPILSAVAILRKTIPALRARMVVPNEELAQQARPHLSEQPIEFCVGGLPQALQRAAVAIASTGTVTMECAYFGVPTVALYKTSWSTYQIGKRIVTVKYLAMPNLLAGEEIYPEFIQERATPENLAHATLELLRNPSKRTLVQERLRRIIASLGQPGATVRAAEAIADLLFAKV